MIPCRHGAWRGNRPAKGGRENFAALLRNCRLDRVDCRLDREPLGCPCTLPRQLRGSDLVTSGGELLHLRAQNCCCGSQAVNEDDRRASPRSYSPWHSEMSRVAADYARVDSGNVLRVVTISYIISQYSNCWAAILQVFHSRDRIVEISR